MTDDTVDTDDETYAQDIPDGFIPDGCPVIGDHECPGCGDPLPEPSVPYGKVEYNGATWHRECAYQDSERIEKVETPRYCRNCWGVSKWHPKDAAGETRLCFTCGAKFKGPVRERPDGPPFDRTEGGA